LQLNTLQGGKNSTTMKKLEPFFHHLNTMKKYEMGQVVSTEFRDQRAQ